MARCAVPARVVAGGTNIRATLALEEVAPLHAARTSQRDVPTTLNTYRGEGRGEGEPSVAHPTVRSVWITSLNIEHWSFFIGQNQHSLVHRAGILVQFRECGRRLPQVDLGGDFRVTNPAAGQQLERLREAIHRRARPHDGHLLAGKIEAGELHQSPAFHEADDHDAP